MGVFDQFPYTNFHELNLDWILRALKEIETTIDQFVAINALKYADPIQWNITSQYEKNTIVIDPQTGVAYISVAAVPTGVALTNTDYWTVVFDLGSFVTRAAKNFTSRYEANTTLTATFNSVAGDWLVWGDSLYIANANITAGDSYIVDGNIRSITMEEIVGHLSDLSTTDKSNLVAAINEVLTTLQNTAGDLNNLSTTNKSNLVAAINELVQAIIDEAIRVDGITGDLDNLSTTNKSNLVNALNEVLTSLNNEISSRISKPYINVLDYGAVGDGLTDDYTAFIDAYTAAEEGSAIIVPNKTYYLSANPDDHSKNIKWIIDIGTVFVGAGSYGGLEGISNGFISPMSNPYNKIVRTNSKIYNEVVAPVGGGICIDNYESKNKNTNSKTITGTITNGSAIMTNVSDLTGVHVGDSILASITGWLDGSTRVNSVRVVSIDTDTNSLEFGSTPASGALPGDGWCDPTPWTGNSQTATFTIRPRNWLVNQYIGVDTGVIDNIDDFNYLINGVFNVNGGVGNALELDINLVGQASGGTNGILLTGIGSYADPNYAIRINRGGTQNWTTGIDIQHCQFGIGITAYQPLLIRTNFYDNQTASYKTPLHGVIFDNISDIIATTRPLFGGEQLVNNATGLLLARATDTTPAGNYIQCLNKARDEAEFFVDVEGNIFARGIIRAIGGFRIQQTAQSITTEQVTKYITIYDQSNNPIKLAVVE